MSKPQPPKGQALDLDLELEDETPDDGAAPAKPKLTPEEEAAEAAKVLQENIDAAFASFAIDKIARKQYFDEASAIMKDKALSEADRQNKLRVFLESDEVKKTNDHAFLRFREGASRILGAKPEPAQGPQTADEAKAEKEKIAKQSTFLEILTKEFGFLGEKIDDNKNIDKKKDANNLSKALTHLSKNPVIAQDKALANSFQIQLNEHNKGIVDNLENALAKGKDPVNEEKYDVAKDAMIKAAQVAAIAALAATGGIFAAALLAGGLYMWHNRNGNKASKKDFDKTKEAEEKEKDFERFMKGEEARSIKAEGEKAGNSPEDIEEALRMGFGAGQGRFGPGQPGIPAMPTRGGVPGQPKPVQPQVPGGAPNPANPRAGLDSLGLNADEFEAQQARLRDAGIRLDNAGNNIRKAASIAARQGQGQREEDPLMPPPVRETQEQPAQGQNREQPQQPAQPGSMAARYASKKAKAPRKGAGAALSAISEESTSDDQHTL